VYEKFNYSMVHPLACLLLLLINYAADDANDAAMLAYYSDPMFNNAVAPNTYICACDSTFFEKPVCPLIQAQHQLHRLRLHWHLHHQV
jgi:hypothetical protein